MGNTMSELAAHMSQSQPEDVKLTDEHFRKYRKMGRQIHTLQLQSDLRRSYFLKLKQDLGDKIREHDGGNEWFTDYMTKWGADYGDELNKLYEKNDAEMGAVETEEITREKVECPLCKVLEYNERDNDGVRKIAEMLKPSSIRYRAIHFAIKMIRFRR